MNLLLEGVSTIAADLTSTEAVKGLLAQTSGHYGGLDMLIRVGSGSMCLPAMNGAKSWL